jgi:asparagine synthase (glutamine-hydrolysing)
MVSEVPIESADLVRARDALAHRGPDGAGIWVDAERRVGLAHRRLSILDLSSAGDQPMTTAEGSLWVTYNGEMYNFLELRAELEGLGHPFRSRTDTEVVLRAYLQWGDQCVRRFRGMFALGLWDTRRRRLLLARDRLGQKPLYYYQDPRRFAFASELKGLTAFPGFDLAPDDSALYDFLTYGYVPAPKTPYARIRKLPPAHILVLEAGRTRLESYWDVDFTRRATVAGEAAVDAVRERLDDAVRSHLVADVPVGSLLSGGIDSTAVTAFAQRVSSTPLHTFSIGFDVAAHSEVHFARRAAEAFGTDHVEETVTAEMAAAIQPRLRGIYDEPYADASAIPTLLVSTVARRQVKVVLSGDGGDEVFAGYPAYARHLRRARFRFAPRILRDRAPAWIETTPLMRIRGMPTLVDGLRPELERHVLINGGWTPAAKRRILRPEVTRRYRDYDDYWYFRQYWREDLDLLSRLQYLDLKTYLPDDILTKVDRASMSVGLEVRPPLLDHLLVEMVASLPTALRNPRGALKHIFKKAVAGLVPREIIDRAKKGFGVPLYAWGEKLALPAAAGASDHQRWLLSIYREWEGSPPA